MSGHNATSDMDTASAVDTAAWGDTASLPSLSTRERRRPSYRATITAIDSYLFESRGNPPLDLNPAWTLERVRNALHLADPSATWQDSITEITPYPGGTMRTESRVPLRMVRSNIPLAVRQLFQRWLSAVSDPAALAGTDEMASKMRDYLESLDEDQERSGIVTGSSSSNGPSAKTTAALSAVNAVLPVVLQGRI